MSAKRIKLPNEKRKGSFWILLVTGIFLVIGIILTIIAYRDTLISWMSTTGIALMVVALIPLGIYGYNLINKKIDS